MPERKLIRLAMVGGGEGAFIGAVHRMAVALDGDWRLVGGAFSRDAGANGRTGAMLNLDPARVYASLQALIEGERARPADERIEAIAIVTPNHLHAPMAIAALEAGFHVMSEKPMAVSLEEAHRIRSSAQASGRAYALAFTYSGYPMIEEARARVAEGALGRIRLVSASYSQGWLSKPIDADGNRQAEWRTDPARAGAGGCLGDIGTHAFHLAEHVSGVKVETLSADLTAHVEGRRLDDDVNVLLRFEGGARGMLKATQVSAGDENDLRLRIAGEKGSLEWAQMEPNSLVLRWLDRPTEVLRTGGPGVGDGATARTRVPAGHPEGYVEAFANLYRGLAAAIREGAPLAVPGIADGVRTMAFIEACVANSAGDEKWTRIGTD